MSAKAAPHYNAIPRGFPNVRFVAVDTYTRSEVISTFAIYAVPTVFLFHNGRIHARFINDSINITSLANFIETYTGIHLYLTVRYNLIIYTRTIIN